MRADLFIHSYFYSTTKHEIIQIKITIYYVREYKEKGGYSAVELEHRVTYVIRIMFMNFRVKKIIMTKFIHMIHSFFYRYNLHNYLKRS